LYNNCGKFLIFVPTEQKNERDYARNPHTLGKSSEGREVGTNRTSSISKSRVSSLAMPSAEEEDEYSTTKIKGGHRYA